MTGRQFEDLCVKRLQEAGFWAHRIAPDETGQQPFDIIAVKGGRVCAYDAKVISSGVRFPLSRVEDNQINALSMIERKGDTWQTGLLIWSEIGIRFLSLALLKGCIMLDRKSVDVTELPEWRAEL